jgi:hypothetical protein
MVRVLRLIRQAHEQIVLKDRKMLYRNKNKDLANHEA